MDEVRSLQKQIVESGKFGLGQGELFVSLLNEFARWNDHVSFKSGKRLEIKGTRGCEMEVTFPRNPSKADLIEIAGKISVEVGKDKKLEIGERWSKIGRFLLENADSATVIFKKKIDDSTQVPLNDAKGIKYEELGRKDYQLEVTAIGNVFVDLAEQLGVARTEAKLTGVENREVSRILLGKSPVVKSKKETINSENTTYAKKVLPMILNRLLGSNIRNQEHQELVRSSSIKFSEKALGELQRPEKEVLRAIFGRGKEFLRKNLTVRAIGLDSDELIYNYLKVDAYKSRIEAAPSESERDDIKLEFIKNLHETIHPRPNTGVLALKHLFYKFIGIKSVTGLQYDKDDVQMEHHFRSFSVKGILDRNMTQCQGYSLIAEAYCESLGIQSAAILVPEHAANVVNIGERFYLLDLGHSLGPSEIGDSLSLKDKLAIKDNVVSEISRLDNVDWLRKYYAHLINKPNIYTYIGASDTIIAANLRLFSRLFFETMEYREAKLYLEYSLLFDNTSISAQYLLGDRYTDYKQYDNARTCYLRYLSIDPTDFAIYNSLGNVFLLEKNYVEAEENYLKALKLNPDFFIPYGGLGNVYFEREDYQRAREYYEKFRSKAKNNPSLVSYVESANERISECENFLQKT